jgi:hypothetical protein
MEPPMSLCSLANEAANCRALSYEFPGRPEEALLRRLAEEFESLAVQHDWPVGFHDNDLKYFEKRACQESTAAVEARHPKARLAHLKMAQRYDGLSRAVRMP